jgi:hypothetical protein|tara:strand:- start:1405 stop:1674 length:270 start_codon:yes stop_codon:yes gene_type:complete
MKDMETFEYTSSCTFQENFEKWYAMNSDEKSFFNETPYTRKEGETVFYDMYQNFTKTYEFRNKFAHSLKVNANGVLEDVLVVEGDTETL